MISFREFRTEDTSAIATLHAETVRAVNSKDYPPEHIAAWTADERNVDGWRQSLRNSICYVAEFDGCIVGFGDVQPTGEVARLYVHKDFQGKGIGRTLLERLETYAKLAGLNELFLDSSISAHRFYQRQGYVDEGEVVREFRGTPLQAYHMRKRLM